MLGKRINVIAFLNAYLQGVSGGDSRFVEIMKRLCEKNAVNLTVVTSRMGKSFCKERELNAIFKVTTRENKVDSSVLLYLMRIVSSLRFTFKIENRTILYAASQFLPDVLPIYVLRHGNKNVRWVQTLYHLVPPPTRRDGSFVTNFFSFSAQKIALALVRRQADLIFVLNHIVVLIL